MRRLVLAGLAALTTLALGTGTAATRVIEREHYSGTESSSFDDCGFTLNVESTFSGVFHFRVHKGGEAFLVHDNYKFRDVLTNPATGRSFVTRGNGLYHELNATQVSGTIYEFVALESGQPFVIEDSSGRVVVRDRGVIRTRFLFDTLGDGMPGGEFVELLEVSVHGPHPGFADDFPFCEIAARLTGA
jgi:hypothetical protein